MSTPRPTSRPSALTAARNRSATVDFPDFTRGAWKKKCNSNLMDAEMDVSQIDFSTVGKLKGQMSV